MFKLVNDTEIAWPASKDGMWILRNGVNSAMQQAAVSLSKMCSEISILFLSCLDCLMQERHGCWHH